jgi:hypothetical protein
MRGADLVRGLLLDTFVPRSCRGVVARELPSDLTCVTRGGGGSEVRNPAGLGLTDGLGG